MPDVTVHVYCKDCSEITDDPIEMIGDKVMYENQDARTQSRNYTCPDCDHEVNILLDFRGN
jgi:predicted RNA-binding Zn-ribbon protein involved in translation (DUF1610 family)